MFSVASLDVHSDHMRAANILGVIAAGLSACSGGTGAESPTPPTTPAVEAPTSGPATASPSTAPTSTLPPPPTTQATTTLPPPTTTTIATPTPAQAYLLIVGPNNQVQNDLWAKYAGSPRGSINTVAKYAAWCAESAPLDEALAAQLKAVAWPADVIDEMTRLLNALAVEAGAKYACAKATNWDGVAAAYPESIPDETSAAASLVRAALGLPLDR
jgi:hypothetical protein